MKWCKYPIFLLEQPYCCQCRCWQFAQYNWVTGLLSTVSADKHIITHDAAADYRVPYNRGDGDARLNSAQPPRSVTWRSSLSETKPADVIDRACACQGLTELSCIAFAFLQRSVYWKEWTCCREVLTVHIGIAFVRYSLYIDDRQQRHENWNKCSALSEDLRIDMKESTTFSRRMPLTSCQLKSPDITKAMILALRAGPKFKYFADSTYRVSQPRRWSMLRRLVVDELDYWQQVSWLKVLPSTRLLSLEHHLCSP